MAEIIININPASSYEDGDIVCAFNNHSVQRTHAEQICHYQHSGFTNDGLRPEGKSLDFLNCVYQYRFERVSNKQVKRVETDCFGNILSEEIFGEGAMDADAYLRRRLRNPKHRIFGLRGAEIWHGGKGDFSQDALERAWNIVQNNCECRLSSGPCPSCGQDHTLWPMGRLDVRHFLCTQLQDFSDVELAALVSDFSMTFNPGEAITDPDGDVVTPTWSDENFWEHPTGGWLYTKDSDTQVVSVLFKKRNMKVADWRDTTLERIQKTESEIVDRNVLVGREVEAVVENAPWLNGNPLTQKVLDHEPFNDPSRLYNKRDKRQGERISS